MSTNRVAYCVRYQSPVRTCIHTLRESVTQSAPIVRTEAAPRCKLPHGAHRAAKQPRSPHAVVRSSVDRRESQRQAEPMLAGSDAHGNAAAVVVFAILVLVLIVGVRAAARAKGLQVVAQPVFVGVA